MAQTDAPVIDSPVTDSQATEINHTLAEMVYGMQAINAAGEKIVRIVKTIGEIAFQTNLLALNATLQAAGAGQAASARRVAGETGVDIAAVPVAARKLAP